MSDSTIRILKDFQKDYTPFLEGAEQHKHFIIQQGAAYCVRESCEGCSFKDNGCEVEEEEIQMYPLPNARRGIGYEEKPFLVLKFQDGVKYEDVPTDLLEGNMREALDPANLHFLLKNPDTSTLLFFKGQIRLYNYSPLQFDESVYSNYFYLYQIYDPQHIYLSMDFSAVEPRIATLTSRCASWLKAFQGEPKTIFKQVEFPGADPELVAKVPYVYKPPKEDKLYCYAEGELDKLNYPKQCSKCKLKDHCKVNREHKKNIASDWHGVNRKGLYGKSKLAHIPQNEQGHYLPQNEDDEYLLKELRNVSKVVGLALCYGGSAYTVSNNMNESKEQAQEKINDFFSELPDLLQYMENAKRAAVESGMVYNVFGRSRSVKADLDMGWKGRGYAERTALNHPIQSTAAEFMKIAMIRVGELIIKKGWNPLWGLQVPAWLDPQQTKYTDIKFSMISSVHDELLYLIMKCIMEEVIPEVHMTMQCQDIMDTFQSGYSFEMDCELDTTRSWTATIKYDSAKIYLLRFLLNQTQQKENVTDFNGYTLKFVEMTQDVLNFIKSSGESGSAYSQGDKLYKLAILKDEVAYRHSSLFNTDFFTDLQDKFGVVVSQAVL